jgi:hypothetical protein
LDALLDFERSEAGRLHVVAVATDDAINADAKIGLRKRLWKDYSQQERVAIEIDTVERALTAGVPVYTGELKIDWFYRQLEIWRPDAIIVCVCGQIFDASILGFPHRGAYNFHPADLASGHGAGPQFLEDNIARDDPWTRWTVHQMSDKVDGGDIIGRSPPIFIADDQGRIAIDPKPVHERLRLALRPMVHCLGDELVRQTSDDGGGPVDSLPLQTRFSDRIRERLSAIIA